MFLISLVSYFAGVNVDTEIGSFHSQDSEDLTKFSLAKKSKVGICHHRLPYFQGALDEGLILRGGILYETMKRPQPVFTEQGEKIYRSGMELSPLYNLSNNF